MTRIEKELDHFFACYGDIYDSPNDLQVIWTHGNRVLVSAPWLSTVINGDGNLGICFESNSYTEFLKAFKIKGNVADAIKQIKARDLMDLYLKGKGEVDCDVGEDGQILWFKRMTNGRMLVTDVFDTEHEITHWLEEPEQFISYTRQYYKIGRYPKEYVSLDLFNGKEKYLTIN